MLSRDNEIPFLRGLSLILLKFADKRFTDKLGAL